MFETHSTLSVGKLNSMSIVDNKNVKQRQGSRCVLAQHPRFLSKTILVPSGSTSQYSGDFMSPLDSSYDPITPENANYQTLKTDTLVLNPPTIAANGDMNRRLTGSDSFTLQHNAEQTPWRNRRNRSQNILLHVCSSILILEFAERVSYYGINQGLKNYLGKLGWSQVGSNALKSTWTSICYLSPLFGGYIADEKWGRFQTLAIFGIWYTAGVFLISLSAYPTILQNHVLGGWLCHLGLFAGVAIGTGAIKANVITFGADQFDPECHDESVQQQLYFTSFYTVINLGALFSYGYLSILCVQGSGAISPEYGYFATFIICGAVMTIAYLLFLYAYPRYVHIQPHTSAITELWSILRGNCAYSYEARMLYYGLWSFGAASFLNLIAAFLSDENYFGQYLSYTVVICCVFGSYVWIRYGMNAFYMDKSMASNGGKYDDETVEEIKQVVRVLPFSCFMIIWECVYDQLDANLQSITQQCDLRLNPAHSGDADAHQVPGAMLGIFDPLTIIILIPLLDTVIYPWYTKVVGRPPSAYGKVLAGLIISTVAMFWAGIFEILRRNSGEIRIIDSETGSFISILDRGSSQPMNHMYWAYAIPNYVLVAIAECLINVTAYELFYREVPIYLKSTCQAINLFMVAMGSNLTSTLTLLFQSFFPQSLNDGNLEYMFYTLGALGVVNIVFYCMVMESMKFGMNPPESGDDADACAFGLDGSMFDTEFHNNNNGPGSGIHLQNATDIDVNSFEWDAGSSLQASCRSGQNSKYSSRPLRWRSGSVEQDSYADLKAEPGRTHHSLEIS